MPDLMKTIEGRRSIRKFKGKDVPQDLLEKVLEAVRWAPSWANTQCWDIIVVRDSATKEKIQKTIGPKNPAAKAVVAAPVLLAVCGKKGSSGFYNNRAPTKFGDWLMFDLGIATQNIALAAHGLGLATVIVGLFDHDGAGKVLAVPNSHELVVLIPLGYPAKSPSAPKRREIAEFTHYDSF